MRRALVLGMLILAACSNEEPGWRTATAENTVGALEGFLAVHPDGAFADSAKDQIQGLQLEEALATNTIDGFLTFLEMHPTGPRSGTAQDAVNALYEIRARGVPPLTAITHLRDPTRLWILNGADGMEIARRFRGDGRWLLVEKATGDTLYATGLDANGAPTTIRFICIDEAGRIARNPEGGAVLLAPFSYHTFVEPGSITSREEYDPYGRPNLVYDYPRGCLDCAISTGVSDCVYVW